MKLMRLAAAGAVSLGLLVVPISGTALAGTAQAGTAQAGTVLASFSGPVPAAAVGCPPIVVRPRPPASGRVYWLACCLARPHAPNVLLDCCAPLVVSWPRPVTLHVSTRPVAVGCARPLTFSVPHGSAVFTEVRGPRLAVHELVFYRGRIYTISSVRGHRFTLDYRGVPFVNEGSAIRDGHALVEVGGVIVWRVQVSRQA